VDKIPGRRLAKKAEEPGNTIQVPMARGLGLVELLKRTFKEIEEDHLAAFAGNLTYKGLFALFPFFVFLLSLLGLFGAPDLLVNLLEQGRGVLPQGAMDLLEGQLMSIAGSKAQGAFTVGAVVSILLALWGISGAFRSVMEAMNVMYEVEEARPAWKKYLISILLSLGVAALLLFALGLVVFGPELGGAVADVVGLGFVFQLVWTIVQWPVLIFIVMFAFALVYYYAPDVEQRFKWISPGSIVAVAAWLVFSLLFALYVDNFGSYNATYGSLAGIIILMLYIYYSSFIMLVGAELNQVIEEHIPGGKDEGEKTLNIESEGKDEGEKARNTERIEREQTAAGETPERIEREMSEIRNRMTPDLSDLREHVEPQAVKEQIKRSLRERLRGILSSAKQALRRRLA
jgi:membrane protein